LIAGPSVENHIPGEYWCNNLPIKKDTPSTGFTLIKNVWVTTIFLSLLLSAEFLKKFIMLNPVLYTAWLNNYALTLKRNTVKYYFGEKSSFLHTFLKVCCESRKI
jgi:hypothetical protein